MAVPYARRWQWVQKVTGKDTVAAAAQELGEPRSTLSRWLKNGMPVGSLMPLIMKYQCDLIEAGVVWGYLSDDDLQHLDYESMVRYIPIDVLTREVNRRAEIYTQSRPDTERKGVIRLGRSDNIDRQSFRLTGKES